MNSIKLATVAMAVALMLLSSAVYASGVGECSGGACGTPDTSGGGGPCVEGDCAGCGAGSVLVNNTDLGDTYQYADDYDNDGREDDVDNCPFLQNLDQLDSDGDGVGDVCDLCPSVANKVQLDADGDGLGDACDGDIDNDGLENLKDNCPQISNPGQLDSDLDGSGNACDLDDDNDGVLDLKDNCPLVANADQLDSAPNIHGDACDNDEDQDNVDDAKDNCPTVANLDQADADGDGRGDACDGDIDGDEVPNAKDNCPALSNAAQIDVDRDGRGNACDQRYCYVVNADEENCLDPTMVFTVYSPSMQLRTGEPARLRLFANRANRAIRYTWTVVERPSGSTATVSNPRGAVRMSSPYEYFYLKNNIATFTPDEPGSYKIKLSGELVFPDAVRPDFPRASSYVMTVTAEGESVGGCAVGGGASGAGLGLLLALGLFLLRRRR